ncbi:MAG TPA: pirin family protein, partial [Chitinophagaceae bacterium]
LGTTDGGVQIHQDAWFSLGKLDEHFKTTYQLKKSGNGVYAFVIEGQVTINGEQLNRRDGLAITETDALEIESITGSELLLMEVPV